MGIPVILTQAIPSRTGVRLMARIRGQGGALVTQASISTITGVVTDITLEKAAAGSGFVSSTVLAPSTVIFDQLQWDLTWQKDGPNNPAPSAPFGDGSFGYNFAWMVPAVSFGNSGDRFQVDIKIVPVTGEQFELSYQIPTFPVYA